MERRLVAPPSQEHPSWLWSITNADKWYIQEIHHDAAGGYRSRISYFALDAGSLADRTVLWRYEDGLFESTDEALEFGELMVESHSE
jgi:hypothetical protein